MLISNNEKCYLRYNLEELQHCPVNYPGIFSIHLIVHLKTFPNWTTSENISICAVEYFIEKEKQPNFLCCMTVRLIITDAILN